MQIHVAVQREWSRRTRDLSHVTCYGFLVYLFMATLRCRRGHYTLQLWFLSPFCSTILSGRRVIVDRRPMSTHDVAFLKCAARSSLKIQNAKNRHLHTIAQQLCRTLSSQMRHVLTIGKKLLDSKISSTCSHNMVNFGPLMAEID